MTMLTVDELISIYGLETVVRLTNDDPNASISLSSVNYDVLNPLIDSYNTRYGELLSQKPYLKYHLYRLIILELHLRRDASGKQEIDIELRKEYDTLKSVVDLEKIIILSVYQNGKEKD